MKWRSFFTGGHQKGGVDVLRAKIQKFQSLLGENNRVLELMAEAEESFRGDFLFDMQYLRGLAGQLEKSVKGILLDLNFITENRYLSLFIIFEKISAAVNDALLDKRNVPDAPLAMPLAEVDQQMSDVVGEKMARLGEIQKRLPYRIPKGFIITSQACQRFFRKTKIGDKIVEVETAIAAQNISPHEAESQLSKFILNEPLPRDIARQMKQGIASLEEEAGGKVLLAVRSSAIGEDGRLSFAGLHETLLGVQPAEASRAYQEVVASLFTSRAITYRLHHGEPLSAARMAVGFLRMIPATASGVAYTLDPNAPEQNTMLVSAAPGLGKTVVEGKGNSDRFIISRHPPHPVISREVAHKEKQYEIPPQGGMVLTDVPSARAELQTVSDDFLARLAKAALHIEKHMKSVQDIEWAEDDRGELVILQARPLRIIADFQNITRRVQAAVQKHATLISGRGTISCRGIAHGTVVVVKDENKLPELPANTVLVARNSSPKLAELVPAANAVITDIGAAAGHLATITREFRVPSIMDVGIATQVLRDGMEVTVDAEENIIYEGKVEELLLYDIVSRLPLEDAREFRILSRMLKRIVPLILKDPQARNFKPQNCKSYHDIIRFAHEKAVEYLLEGSDQITTQKNTQCKKVFLQIPIDLTVIDIGGGLVPSSSHAAPCDIAEVNCAALRSLLEGLTSPGAWSTEPAGMDMGSFMSSVTGPGILMESSVQMPQRNLAIISDRYLNLNLHLGYHFNQVDSYLSETRNDNYIYFRFAGGVTDSIRRSRRARMISIILQKFDFMVEITGDFIIARLKKFERRALLDRHWMLGYLIGFTRQMDVSMRDDSMVEKGVDKFMKTILNHKTS
jgi:pyruvate,water dikinase